MSSSFNLKSLLIFLAYINICSFVIKGVNNYNRNYIEGNISVCTNFRKDVVMKKEYELCKLYRCQLENNSKYSDHKIEVLKTRYYLLDTLVNCSCANNMDLGKCPINSYI